MKRRSLTEPSSPTHNDALPPRTVNPQPPSTDPAKGRIWKNSEIARFYDDDRRGVFKDRAEEKRRIELDIFAAQAENRIVMNA